MDEQMKVRVQRNVVCSFDQECKYFQTVPIDLWMEMFDDHQIQRYKQRLVGKTTLID